MYILLYWYARKLRFCNSFHFLLPSLLESRLIDRQTTMTHHDDASLILNFNVSIYFPSCLFDQKKWKMHTGMKFYLIHYAKFCSNGWNSETG